MLREPRKNEDQAQMRSLPAGLVALLLCGGAASPLAAEPGRHLPAAVESVRLLPGWSREDGVHVAAIAIRLAPGWHTYWRAPGANGVPPEFDWSASGNLAAVGYEWPRPMVFDSYGAPTIGYEGSLVLPVLLTPGRPDAAVEARLDLFFGVCSDVCIPAEVRIEARLDPAVATNASSEHRGEIERALADRPLDAAALGVTARCALAAEDGGRAITAEILSASGRFGRGATTVIEADARPDLWIGPARTRADGDRLLAVAPLEASGGAAALDRSALRVTVLEPDRAIDIRGCAGG